MHLRGPTARLSVPLLIHSCLRAPLPHPRPVVLQKPRYAEKKPPPALCIAANAPATSSLRGATAAKRAAASASRRSLSNSRQLVHGQRELLDARLVGRGVRGGGDVAWVIELGGV